MNTEIRIELDRIDAIQKMELEAMLAEQKMHQDLVIRRWKRRMFLLYCAFIVLGGLSFILYIVTHR